MGTENSSAATRQRAALLASQIGAFHYHITIDLIVQAVLTVFAATTTRTPKYISQVPPGPNQHLDTLTFREQYDPNQLMPLPSLLLSLLTFPLAL